MQVHQKACTINYVTDKMAVYRVRSVLQAAWNSFKCTSQSAARILMSTPALALDKQSDEETSDGLDGQDASRPLSVDRKAVPGGEQAPTQGRPRRSDPDLSTVRRSTVSWSALVDRVDSCIYVYCGCM